MSWPNTPENRPMCRQINWLFFSSAVRDIDFSKWFDSVSMIVDYDHYFGDDIPHDGVAPLKFINVHLFTFQKNTIEEEQRLGLHIRKFSKELNRETGKRYYCLVLAKTSFIEDKLADGCQLEIHFEDIEVKFLSHSLRCENEYGGFLSPKEREQLLRNQ